MQVHRVRSRPRCADCGSSAIICEGEMVWHMAAQEWRALQPTLDRTESGLCTAREPRTGFFCRDCETNVAIRFGRG